MADEFDPENFDAETMNHVDRVEAAIYLTGVLQGLVSTIRDAEGNARLSGGLGFAEQGLGEAHDRLTDYREELEDDD